MNVPPHRSRPAYPEIALGLAVLGFAGIVFAQTLAIPVSPLYSRVGPTVFPYMTAGGLAICGALLLLTALRGGWQDADERQVALDWRALAWLAVGLTLNVALIGLLGFTLASTLMFACVARAFGSRKLLRDVGIGLAVSLAAYFGFSRALGVTLGQGYLERLLGG